MNRYGFNVSEVDNVVADLRKYPKLKIQSICSHLAASDNSTEDTVLQTNNFKLLIIYLIHFQAELIN